MTALKDIQQLARDTIFAGPSEAPDYFASESVLVDDGSIDDDIEAALNARGFVVIVDLPREPRVLTENPGVVHQEWCIPVWIQLNPEKNPTGAGKDILEAVQNLYAALLQYSDANQSEKFSSDQDNPGDLYVNDSGLLNYLTRFRKIVNLS